MFWGYFTFHRVGSLYPVTGMMNAEKYSEVMRQKVVREMERTHLQTCSKNTITDNQQGNPACLNQF